jgi:hypothetical protein
MPLAGRQIKQIQESLLDAFPSKAHLEMMVRLELDSLDQRVHLNRNLRLPE